MAQTAAEAPAAVVAAAAAGGGEEGARHTLYVNNLNEKVKVEELKALLRQQCAEFGTVLDVVARDTLRTRGQAFVVFEDEQAAARALTALQGRDLRGKPMRVAFARTKSDAIAARDGTLAERRTRRELLRQRRIAEEKIARRAAKRARKDPAAATTVAAAIAAAAAAAGGGVPPPLPVPGVVLPPVATQPPVHQQPPVLPPAQVPMPLLQQQQQQQQQQQALGMVASTMVLVDHLPLDAAQDAVRTMLAEMGAADGLKQCQLVPAKPGLAFLEFETVAQAAAARQKLDGHALGAANTLSATFAAT